MSDDGEEEDEEICPFDCCPEEGCVSSICPECWTEGCGLDGAFGCCADVVDVINPCLDAVAKGICFLGSPIAFPLIFCFDPSPHTNESSGWSVSMLRAPLKRPFACCFATICMPCGQWDLRRRALDGDFTKYKLWQGYHDGPQCFATVCPSAPITIESGTYGEQDCPRAFLFLEVCCLGLTCSPCCSFYVSRQYMMEDRDLDIDPTEARFGKCQEFFYNVMETIMMIACCAQCFGCCVGCCAPDSEGAQELEEETRGCSSALYDIARTIRNGLTSVEVLAIGCMSAQMVHEHIVGVRGEKTKLVNGEDDDKDDDDDSDEEVELAAPNSNEMKRDD
mmetsp:Transcript_31983/g.39227  ORF Transcript_31983/g.39227 Transcript_31983/m.39227 type:complete len:335 (-) Transcript_31983:134-1138(-)|eukprot:CAMPEP_0172496750 /NCGR_PEP_ID=MMETSP1066-20121228/92305_1 /TAXON_ID=671091 /ORGANISM="Coscinodiscus wailesii, Strain CCMP2513" /LENGTH=334 /DNA_ID=CAMNT_0013269197 /DNA_START=26 /DNA_END=1030 /DNA_ORIENTATION=-